MNIMTHEKTIKIHTLQLDDNEIDRFLDKPDELEELLRDLLVSKPTGQEKNTSKVRKASTRVHCQYCDRLVSSRQITNHENKCPSRTASAE